ncbi:methyl-accepting chemotaxis protein [Tissierella sp. Yu-01]|uniref:methyl-accepting chemotaxis protein n=1 Tax=Tissierella sp. Yu-01 TaxID=3035694 RepID=UPI00240D160E|nr:methyl-accepting chemotaxis protein [Tissierella sp. Yu-01]WFA08611.1 methyl-accepting chemotaxis protein [Tissierella sp. Yu-01]
MERAKKIILPKLYSLKITKFNGGFKLSKSIRIKSIKTKLIITFTLIILLSSITLARVSIKSASDAILYQTDYSLAQLAIDGSELTKESVDNQLKKLQKIANKSEIQSKKWELQKDTIIKERVDSGFDDLAILQLNGVASFTDGTTLDLNDREYFQRALDGQPNVSDLVISKTSNQPILVFAAPIYNGDMVVGVIIGRMHGNTLSEIISEVNFGAGGFSFMINDEGTIVAHPDEKKVMEGYNPIKESNNDNSLNSFAELVMEINEIKIGRGSYSIDGKEYLVGFKPVEDTNWTIATVLEKDQVLSAIPALTQRITIIVIAILIVCMIFTYIIGSLISNPVIAISRISSDIANLDIRNNIPEKYLRKNDETGELSRAFQNIIDNLRQIINQINNTTDNLTEASDVLSSSAAMSKTSIEELSNSIEEISHGAQEQAMNTEGGAKLINELGDYMESNKRYMSNLRNETESVTAIINQGLKDVDRLSEITDESSMALGKIHDAIQKTNESSNRIDEASKLISTIASQTNLLALNAAIEAARSGEAGRGFAVVSDEIRKLAEESEKSASIINKMVKELQTNSVEAVKEMTRVNDISKEQQNGIIDNSNKYNSIYQEIEEVNKAVAKSIESVDEMNKKKNSVLDMINNLTAIAEEYSASTEVASSSMNEQTLSVEQIANSSKNLAKLSFNLKDIINSFKI